MTERLGSGLYAIADTGLIAIDRLLEAVEQALLGGARLIQYRDKTVGAHRVDQARALAALCRAHRAPLIINDDIELANWVDADGVHLGKDDPPPALARQWLGPQAIIGVSCYNQLGLALEAVQAGADYVAFGSFFLSPTKPTAVRADIHLLSEARQALTVPLVAIGGITPANGKPLVEAGADYLAVVSGVFAQAPIRAAAQAYADLFAPRVAP